MFEYKTTVRRTDDEGNEVEEPITLQFKDYDNAPGRISRYNQGNMERQLWLSFEWGLVEPKHWPEDSDLPGHLVLDDISQGDITDCYNEWQRAAWEKDSERDKKRKAERERKEAEE